MTKPSITPENIVKHVTVSNILNSSLDITSVFILKVSIISSSAIPRTIRVVTPVSTTEIPLYRIWQSNLEPYPLILT